MKFLIECVAPFAVGCAPLGGVGISWAPQAPQQCSPHSGVSLGCWGPPAALGLQRGQGAGGSPRAGKLQLRLIAGFKQLLCLTNKSVYSVWIWEGGSLSEQEMENRSSQCLPQARREGEPEMMGVCELPFIVNCKQLLAAFPSPRF